MTPQERMKEQILKKRYEAVVGKFKIRCYCGDREGTFYKVIATPTSNSSEECAWCAARRILERSLRPIINRGEE